MRLLLIALLLFLSSASAARATSCPRALVVRIQTDRVVVHEKGTQPRLHLAANAGAALDRWLGDAKRARPDRTLVRIVVDDDVEFAALAAVISMAHGHDLRAIELLPAKPSKDPAAFRASDRCCG